MTFAYDAVPYDTEANAEAHPRSMETIGRLYGLDAACASTARVLELGCGEGEHLIAAASYLPSARFVGFDLSKEAIARGLASAAASGITNVELLHRDVREVRATSGLVTHEPRAPEGRAGLGTFDYVVAHGLFSWVPDAIRPDVLAVMRDALAPNGVAFLSVNALPGWELRRALRAVMREASRQEREPEAQVGAALRAVADLATVPDDEPSFAGVLGAAAREYLLHAARAKPPEAPFSGYVFHDLLAEYNEPFSTEDLVGLARGAGLRVLCDTPGMRPPRELSAFMVESGAPFLQVLLCRDDASARSEPDVRALATAHVWADLRPAGKERYQTTAGAVLQAPNGSPLARVALHAPKLASVASVCRTDEEREAFCSDLFAAMRAGALLAASTPIHLGEAYSDGVTHVSPHVRSVAERAVESGASSAVVTSALHRSFRVPKAELLVVRDLDGTKTEAEIAARSGVALRDVAVIVDRFARHGFLLHDVAAAVP